MVPPPPGCAPIHTSRALHDRAFRLLQVLLTAFEARGYAVAISEKATTVTVLEETLALSLHEGTKNVAHKITFTEQKEIDRGYGCAGAQVGPRTFRTPHPRHHERIARPPPLARRPTAARNTAQQGDGRLGTGSAGDQAPARGSRTTGEGAAGRGTPPSRGGEAMGHSRRVGVTASPSRGLGTCTVRTGLRRRSIARPLGRSHWR